MIVTRETTTPNQDFRGSSIRFVSLLTEYHIHQNSGQKSAKKISVDHLDFRCLLPGIWSLWMFPKIGGEIPPNHPWINRVFHYFHHPFWGTHPYFWISTHIDMIFAAFVFCWISFFWPSLNVCNNSIARLRMCRRNSRGTTKNSTELIPPKDFQTAVLTQPALNMIPKSACSNFKHFFMSGISRNPLELSDLNQSKCTFPFPSVCF